MAWWTRRQFYTFHKDEIITVAHLEPCPSPLQVEPPSTQEEEIDEWNNESESDDAGDLTSNDDDTVEDAYNHRYDYNNSTHPASESDLGTEDEDVMLETIHEEASLEASPPRVRTLPVVTPSPPRKSSTSAASVAYPVSPPSSLKIYQTNGNQDSVSGSLESMDSLLSSQWDPEDDVSTVTPQATNLSQQTNDAFFVEHVKFLQIQTQPRTVEEVYKNDQQQQEGPMPE